MSFRCPPDGDGGRQLVEIWRDVLSLVERVGANDNFFELGGHSLLAVRLFAQIERPRLGVKLPLAALFQSATIAELARMVDDERGPAPSGGHGHRSSRCDREASDPRSSWSASVDGQLIGYQALVEKLPENVPL